MALLEDWHGVPVYSLENEQLKVSLCPSLGNNLFRIWDKTEQVEVLKVPEHPEMLKENPGRYGTPLMLPPSLIRHGKFHFGDRDYQFDLNTQDGHHTHGFLRNHPWTFEAARSDDATMVSSLQTSAFPSILRQYPHTATIEVSYILKGSSLIHRTKATNHGSTAAPFGYGLHTWFRLEQGADKWSLHLPVAELWKPDYQLLPWRDLVPLGELAALQDKLPLQGHTFNHVFRIGDNPRLAVLSREGYEIHYSASELITQWIVYTNGVANDIICLEPITWTPNAPNLHMPAELTGMRSIEPGETAELEVLLEIRRHGSNY